MSIFYFVEEIEVQKDNIIQRYLFFFWILQMFDCFNYEQIKNIYFRGVWWNYNELEYVKFQREFGIQQVLIYIYVYLIFIDFGEFKLWGGGGGAVQRRKGIFI